MGWPIGKASELSGISIETIRYYEREGITPKPERTAAGRRSYDSDIISRLRFVKRCRDLGFSIQDIKSLLALSHSDESTCEDARQIGAENPAIVEGKITDLKRMAQALRELIASCQMGEKHCPMLRELFSE